MKTKSKWLIVILCLIITIFCFTGLVSCNLLLPPTGHTHEWGEWTVTKEATETEKGLKERTCSVCGYKETEDIPVSQPGEKKKGGFPWWLIILAAVLVAAGIIIFIVLGKKKKKDEKQPQPANSQTEKPQTENKPQENKTQGNKTQGKKKQNKKK